MPTIKIPAGNSIQPPRPFSSATLEKVIREVTGQASDFTGCISIAENDVLYLLFFFKGTLYSAGKSIGEKPFALSIREFFREVGAIADHEATITVHATDPVLLKCLLIFIQDDVTVKAPTNLIDLESVLAKIKQEACDALIILEKQGMFNFFFFKDGDKGMSYYADTEFTDGHDLPIDEQMLVYAFQGGNVPVDALIYRTITTSQSSDADSIDPEEMLRLLRCAGDETCVFKGPVTLDQADIIEPDLLLSVIEGVQMGQELSGNIPCVIGRKDSDILIADPLVSKTHAAVQVINGKLLLVDLNSTNGTIVNGNRIRQHELARGDVIVIGSTHLKVLRVSQS